MTNSVTQHTLYSLENKLKESQRNYLRLHGWQRTCNTPGSFWMWKRDFSDIDEKRSAYHPATASPFQPYGLIMADTETAVMMTMRALDIDESGADGSNDG